MLIKEDLLYIFKKLLNDKKISIDEYNRATNIVLKQYT